MVGEEVVTVQTVGREQCTITGRQREWPLRLAQDDNRLVSSDGQA